MKINNFLLFYAIFFWSCTQMSNNEKKEKVSNNQNSIIKQATQQSFRLKKEFYKGFYNQSSDSIGYVIPDESEEVGPNAISVDTKNNRFLITDCYHRNIKSYKLSDGSFIRSSTSFAKHIVFSDLCVFNDYTLVLTEDSGLIVLNSDLEITKKIALPRYLKTFIMKKNDSIWIYSGTTIRSYQNYYHHIVEVDILDKNLQMHKDTVDVTSEVLTRPKPYMNSFSVKDSLEKSYAYIDNLLIDLSTKVDAAYTNYCNNKNFDLYGNDFIFFNKLSDGIKVVYMKR